MERRYITTGSGQWQITTGFVRAKYRWRDVVNFAALFVGAVYCLGESIGEWLAPPVRPRDWAARAARPISTPASAPDWIRERNEVLNRNPMVRIHT